jgi:hypothetical protein
VTGDKADIANEPAVDRECHDANGGKHRFRIALPNQLLRSFQKKSLFAHGIAVVGNEPNAAIAGSGRFQFPGPKWPPDPPTARQSIVDADNRRAPEEVGRAIMGYPDNNTSCGVALWCALGRAGEVSSRLQRN